MGPQSQARAAHLEVRHLLLSFLLALLGLWRRGRAAILRKLKVVLVEVLVLHVQVAQPALPSSRSEESQAQLVFGQIESGNVSVVFWEGASSVVHPSECGRDDGGRLHIDRRATLVQIEEAVLMRPIQTVIGNGVVATVISHQFAVALRLFEAHQGSGR